MGETPYYAVRVLSTDPVITISSCSLNDVHVATLVRESWMNDHSGLHFVHASWNVEREQHADAFAAAFRAAQQALPKHVFVPLVSTEFEAFNLAQRGIAAIQGHGAIYTNENVFSVRSQSDPKKFRAIYNARIDPEKRHELAKDVEGLALIYGWSLSSDHQRSYEETRRVLHRACFLNHERNHGHYTPLSKSELADALNEAVVGLCLSPEEGFMRVSMEYLLCGLAVVSTRSIGGRDRYYDNPYVAIAEPDPQSVSRAVDRLVASSFSPHAIRKRALDMLNFDRRNFLYAINKVVKHYLGVENQFRTFAPFVGARDEFIPHESNLAEVADLRLQSHGEAAAPSEWTEAMRKSARLVSRYPSDLPQLLLAPEDGGIYLRPHELGPVAAVLPDAFPSFGLTVCGEVEIARADAGPFEFAIGLVREHDTLDRSFESLVGFSGWRRVDKPFVREELSVTLDHAVGTPLSILICVRQVPESAPVPPSAFWRRIVISPR